MKTENLTTLQIHKMSKELFQREEAAGNINNTAIYLTPDEFFEDAEHPGCYYRMVEGEKEWINPPMVLNKKYRTTERHNGKPVFITLTMLGVYKRTEDGIINTKPSGTYDGTGGNRTVNIGVDGTALLIVDADGFAIILHNQAGTYVGKDGTITGLTGANCWWRPTSAENGGLFDLVGDSVVNRSGKTYLWSVI